MPPYYVDSQGDRIPCEHENDRLCRWWITVQVDGYTRADGHYNPMISDDKQTRKNALISWVPSVGREFDQDNWSPNEWREIRIRAPQNDSDDPDTVVTFTHEVWGDDADCPVHGVGQVIVRIVDDDNGGGSGGGGSGSGGGGSGGGGSGGGGVRGLPSLSIADTTAIEGETARFAVTLSAPSEQTVTVDYRFSDETASGDEDYNAAVGTITFDPGSTRQIIEVETREDDLDEADETFTVRLSNPSGATLDDDTATGTITDDDEPVPSLSIADTTAIEGETARFAVTLSAPSEQTVTVDYRFSDETASGDEDYNAAVGTITFDPGSTRQIIEVETREDDLDEADETFTVRLSNPSGATLDDDTATGTITDDDEPVPSLSIADTTAIEGETARFAVTLSAPSEQTVTVDYRFSDETASGDEDYNAAVGTITFDPGSTRQIIEVETREDDLDEADETFTVRLSNPSGATLDDDTATGTITDDDEPVPSLSIADTTAIEGETARFAVTLSAPSEQTVTVDYRFSDETASGDEDYNAAVGTITFDPGSTRQIIEVETREDDLDEADETFTVRLSNPSGATLDDDTATGTITDDDEPVPSLSIADTTAIEGETARFAVTLSAPSEQTVTVDYRFSDETASGDEDYNAAVGTITFDPGSTRQIIEVETREDDLDEADETFTVRLSNPSGATLDDDTATGTITDDDEPVPSLSIADTTAIEGETARFAVTLSAPSEQTVTVDYRFSDETASGDEDYNAAVGTITFDPGSTRQIIEVETREDDLDEADETFTVRLSNPSGATLDDDTATGTITDDDEPVPSLSIADTTAIEGETARFAVTLSAPSEQTVTVDYRFSDETASGGEDYNAAVGTITFDPGSTRQIIEVETREDDLDEADETFTVRLSNPSGATLDDDTATGTITDDDMQRTKPIEQTFLLGVGRAIAFTAVHCRFDGALSSTSRGRAQPSVKTSQSQMSTAHGLARTARKAPSVQQMLGSASFHVSSMEAEDNTSQVATWGCGDYRNLASDSVDGTVAWDGEASSMQLGADLRLGSSMLAGMSLSWTKSSLKFDDTNKNRNSAGRYELELIGVHPYLGWLVTPDLTVWGTFGHAEGSLKVVDRNAEEPLKSDTALHTGMLGVKARLLAHGATTLTLKGQWGIARLNVADHTAAFKRVSVDMQQLRLATEANQTHLIPDVGLFTPWGELGFRYDGGDGQTGASLEVGGGLRFKNIEHGFNTEIYGRWLPLQERGLPREWGFGARFRYDPGVYGVGPSVGVTQSWGDTASSVQRLWEGNNTELALREPSATRLDAEVAYGFLVIRDLGILIPYGKMSLDSRNARGYGLGSRLALGRSGTVSLETERREYPAAAAAYTLMARGALRF